MAKEDYMARLNLNWYTAASKTTGSCPPIPVHRCKIGLDADGDLWLCEAEYCTKKHKWLVKFDVDGGEDTPFCRRDVVYSRDYWKAVMEIHSAVWCEYEEIQDEVRAFIILHGIQCKDVCGRPVA